MSDTLHQGQVVIQLGDDEIVLKPTLRTLDQLDRKYNGLLGLAEEVSRLRPTAMVDIVMAGGGFKSSQRDEIARLVFDAGYFELVPKLTRFITILGNGGRPPKPKEDEDDGDEGDTEGNG